MSSIVEFKDMLAVDDEENFVSYESLMGEEEEDVDKGPDLLEVALKEVEKSKEEARRLVSEAEDRVAELEKEAYEKGFQKGEEEGRQVGEEALAEKISQASQVIAAVNEERQRICSLYEKDTLALVLTMVEQLVNHEVSVNHLVIEKCLQKALEFVVDNSQVIAHLHPDDFMQVKDAVVEDPLFLENTDKVELMEDPAISPGGCLLETTFGEIDATLENCKDKLFKAVEQSFALALAETNEESTEG
ncbi:MAG: FliH/SctL family protein [Thermodesulfobacteriota bacterium]